MTSRTIMTTEQSFILQDKLNELILAGHPDANAKRRLIIEFLQYMRQERPLPEWLQ